MSVDNKLETIFVCLQDMKSTGERLLRAERTVRVLHDTTQANKQRIDMLVYRSIDAESRQRRNNLIFWGIPESLNEDAMVVVSEFISDKLVIDYSIASAQALKFVENFEIFEMDSLYTDHHALLETTLKFGSPMEVNKKQENPTSIKSPKWQENKKDNFVLNLDADQINALKLKLRNACDNSKDVTKENINEMCSQITDIFIESAHKSFPNTKTNSNTFQNKQHKRWFGPKKSSPKKIPYRSQGTQFEQFTYK